ncbi:MAG: hypothetical protein GY820_18350, partial [Gammaproteobacteria bacterium]|nr:hypothetical protein [Gammaproteobacteria bacterium]
MMEIPMMRSTNKKGELSLNQRDVDYWEKRNDEYYGAPIMSLSSEEEQAVWNSQWRTNARLEAKEIALTPTNPMHKNFMDSVRREGNANACAELLFYVYEKNKGKRMKVCPEDMAKVQLSLTTLGRKQDPLLYSPSGLVVERQVGLPEREKQKRKKKKKKELKFTPTVTKKPFSSEHPSAAVAQKTDLTAEESMKGKTETDTDRTDTDQPMSDTGLTSSTQRHTDDDGSSSSDNGHPGGGAGASSSARTISEGSARSSAT